MNGSSTTDPGAAYARSNASTSCGENCPRHGNRLLRNLPSIFSVDAGSGELNGAGPVASPPRGELCGCPLGRAAVIGEPTGLRVQCGNAGYIFAKITTFGRQFHTH